MATKFKFEAGILENLEGWKAELEVMGIATETVKSHKKVNKFNGYVSYRYSFVATVPTDSIAKMNELWRGGWNMKASYTHCK